MNEKASYQPSQISSPRKTRKVFTLRNVILLVGIFFISNIILNVFNSVTNEYSQIQQIYKATFNEGEGAGNPVGHYRINSNSVYYYQNCSSPFSKWCKHKLEGVKPGDFVPLNKDFAKIYKNNEAYIYQGHNDVTHKIEVPENFRALEKLESNPRYFSDDEYLYYLGTPRWEIGNNGIDSDSFPLKITGDDLYETPLQFQTPYDITACQAPTNYTRVLFLNNKVYLDGVLLPGADATTFEEIRFDSKTAVVGPWFKDKNKVYLDGHTVVGADPDTIKIHNKSETHGNSCPTPYARIASDKNNVYYADFQPHSIICDNGQEFCNVDIKIPGISPLGLTADPVVGSYALSTGVTISNDIGTYYLDGLKTNLDEQVRVLVGKDWGKEYHENATKNRYRLYYTVSTGQCSVKDTIRTEKQFHLYVNDKLIGSLEFCDRFFDKVSLRPGVNTIRVLSENDQVVFEREYIVQN
jgi:hypothetical protein